MMVDEPTATDVAHQAEPASQQPGDTTPTPESMEQKNVEYYQGEAQKAFTARDDAKAAARAAAAQREEVARQLADLQANTPNVTADDLALLAQVKEQKAQAERDKALKTGDADAIAKNARKPLEEELSAIRQAGKAKDAQLATLLRDNALKDAITASARKPLDSDVVFDAIKSRVQMVESGGQLVPHFVGADGQDLYNAEGKVTDHATFVDHYLQSHPALCKAQSQPGSGAPQPGAGSTKPVTEGRKPTSVAEWNSWTDNQKDAANMQPGELSALTFHQEKGAGMFG